MPTSKGVGVTNSKQGKEFEVFVRNTFSLIKKTHGLSYHRLVDSGAAGGIVSSQPSDFIVGATHKLFYVEVKTSINENFTRNLLRPHQRKAILFDGQVLGIPYYILFYSIKTGLVSVVDGRKALVGDRIDLKYCTEAKVRRDDLANTLIQVWELSSLKSIIARGNNWHKKI